MSGIVLVPAIVAAVATAVGRSTRGERWWNPALGFAGGLWCLVVLMIILDGHDSDVAALDFLAGLGLGVAAVGCLPFLGYYLLGRLPANKTVLLLAWVATLIPYYYYMLYAWIWTVGLVHCPPGAYECPV